MTAKELTQTLKELGACAEAREWAAKKTLAEAWQECPRGDWLLWLAAGQIGMPGWPTHQAVVLAACACAETALVYVPAGEDRPRLAIEIARKWARGEATVAEVRAASAAAYASAASASAYAASAASVAAAASAAAASAFAAYAAPSRSLAQSADLVRSMLVVPTGEQETTP